ncbi:sucrose nonfermenting 4-like protein isoform X2 [Corylus avellana]|uniref:sucrose nonfermenting 4-like protein isoform X2 n=1 Tax=Corylus avellana TaxID=13451 RepID=UPI00286A38F2|nr:sucrose nonfermenting 4-like protein isoform X2 [Corylus avellana]
MDSTLEAAAVVPGTVLIPVRFVWKHGGNSVYLSGSFTQWSQLVPMLPVEGCDNVFQTVYGLMPGYHQYKFYVDGQWRYDESQPYVPGEYGVVNTVLLATDYMDVDNEAFRRMARVTDGPPPEVVPSVSEADLQASRQRISVFLSTHTVYELLPESGKVFALDVDLPVKQAFHMLHEQGIPMAPLCDFGRGQFVGILSALDFILILRELGSHASNLTEEELETHTISAWKEGKAYLNRQNDVHGRAFPRRLIHAGPYDNLKDVALKILQNEVATVPIIHSSSEDGSFPQLLHLASLSGILKCICRYFRHNASSLPILQLPICTIPVGTWAPKIGESNLRPLATLRPTQVSSIPIVDDNDSLLDIYCRSDITALAKDRAYTHINLDEMTIHQALQLGQDSYSPYELRSQRCQMCLRSDSVHKVMERLANPGVRRLVIVEAGSKRVEGIVSLSDVFKFLLG